MEVIKFAGIAFLSMTFISSAVAKVRTKRLRADLAAYRLLPPALLRPLGSVLPWLELAVGVGLILDPTMKPSIAAAVFLLGSFALAMTVNLLRRRDIACGCRGTSRRISWGLVAENLGFVAIALACYFSPPPALGHFVWSPHSVPEGIPGLLTVVLTVTAYRAMSAWFEMARKTSLELGGAGR